MSMIRGARSSTAWLAACLLLGGCSERPSFEPGEECELNTQCGAPLVCRLGRCRVECRAMRDCHAGLECVRDEEELGACQLPDETMCTLTSECPAYLVCRFGQCTNACESDVDCPPGSACEDEGSGSFGCRDQAGRECMLNSDCMDLAYICAPDGFCREPCQNDRDCRDGTVCETTTSPTQCVFPADRVDAGVDAGDVDAGDVDAGALDGGPDAGVDGGGMDGGGSDAGADAGGSDGGFDAGPMVIGTPPDPPRMAGGEGHTCASPATIGPHCWGHNDFGQVGLVGMAVEPSAVALGLTGVTVAGAGARHGCAIHGGGAVSCWGDNGVGQLGIGGGGGTRTSPVLVSGLPGAATDLALGDSHTCVVDTGRLFCFGGNASGQLGIGSRTSAGSPMEVSLPGSSPAVEVASFGAHTCVRLEDYTVYCFGENGSGESGTGSPGADVLSPATPVAGLGLSIHVATGTTHSCAIESGGGVKCWGNDILGQRGDGAGGAASSGTAVSTAPLAGPALQLALGSTHGCAVTATTLECWGDNASGQVGRPRTTLQFNSPVTVTSVGVVNEVAAGTNHTCALDGTRVRCWGDNGWGQLGDGTTGSPDHMPHTVTWP